MDISDKLRNAIKGKTDGNGDIEVVSFRRKIISLRPHALFEMMLRGERHIKVVADGLPEDTKFIGAFYNHQTHSFDLIVESEEFEPILEGEVLPYMDPVFVKEYHCPYVGNDSDWAHTLIDMEQVIDDAFDELERKCAVASTKWRFEQAKEKIKQVMFDGVKKDGSYESIILPTGQ